jgi:manganese/zinc/iron transport system permease protein
MSNPYWGKSFFGFFLILFKRITKQLPLRELPSDEIQLLVLIGVAIAIVPIGTFLTLRKTTMMANALSHTILLGIVLSYLIFCKNSDFHLTGSMLFLSAFIAAITTTTLIDITKHFFHIQKDAAIGLVFTTLFALGIVLVTIFIRNTHIGVEIITGNIDALHSEDIRLAWLTGFINSIFIFTLLPYWILTTFDKNFATSLGAPTRLLHYFLMFLTALSMIAAFRAVGILLVLSFLVGPTIIARQWTYKIPLLLPLATITTIVLSIIGVALSRHVLSVHHIPLSTGGIVANLISLSYIFSTLLTFRSTRSLMKTSS